MSAAAETLLLTSRVPPQHHDLPLWRYLATRFPYHDGAGWRQRIAAGLVVVDGRAADPDQPVRRGATVTYKKPHVEPAAPERIPVLSADADYVVADKPAGLPVHADGAFVRRTAVALLRLEFGPELCLTHRLDRETSGVLVLARHAGARRALQPRFQRGAVRKRYVAVVRGIVAAADLRIAGELEPDPASSVAIRRRVRPGPPAAGSISTFVRTLQRGADRTLVEVVPSGGRTHQIRAHLSHAGHPILGDLLYGESDAHYLAWVRHVKAGGEPGWPSRRAVGRHLLHAAEIEWHDDDGSLRRFTAPLPAEFTVTGDR